MPPSYAVMSRTHYSLIFGPSLLSLHGCMPARIFELKIHGIVATCLVLSRSIATNELADFAHAVPQQC